MMVARGSAAHHRGTVVDVTDTRRLVAVIDDDDSVRESLPDLVREFGYSARPFASAEEFLDSGEVHEASCLILDISLPGMSGPDLQAELIRRKRRIPIIYITAHVDGAIRPRLVARGAVEVLLKPFSEAALLAALHEALGVLP